MNKRKCIHRKTRILKFYRHNYPFGKKSKKQYYNPPKKCIEVCINCGEVLDRWRPYE